MMRIRPLSTLFAEPRSLLLGLACAASLACSSTPAPRSLEQANADAISPAADQARTSAPQAYAHAEQLRQEARSLHAEGNAEEASVVAEQARAAYQEAFAIARGVQAETRLEKAQQELKEAEARLRVLDTRLSETEKDADQLELRARVLLDTEPLGDVEKLTPERALARRQAAFQLTSEARSLCVATRLLNPQVKTLEPLEKELATLEQQLNTGSQQKDLYPRSIQARSGCLKELTDVRRPHVHAAPEAPTTDRLLAELTETNRLFAFRDDRGVVVNVLEPIASKGALNESTRSLLELLGGTAKQHPEFPLLVVVHTAKKGQDKTAEETGKLVVDALRQHGAAQVELQQAAASQPVVDPRVPGAEKQNARVEIVFVSPAF
ncbi:MAG TPA: hypothetical protein VLC09_18190 [Polyangiaceae bacterium]|nr:hypothetical protein [Polyangiaceae bacterium]